MRLRIFTYLLVFIFLFTYCSTKSEEKKTDDTTQNPTKEIKVEQTEVIYTLPIIPDSVRNDHLSYATFLIERYAKDASDYIASNFEMFELTATKVSLGSEGDFVYHPLLYDVSIEGLQTRNNNIFEVEKIELDEKENYMMDEPFYHKLSYKNSYIKVHRLKYEGWECDQYQKIDCHNVVCAIIVDPEIQLFGIVHLGMSKKEFYYRALGLKIPLSVDTLNIGSIVGNIEQQYIFENEKLTEVKISSNYDLADFRFY